jgi:hypothetical protein
VLLVQLVAINLRKAHLFNAYPCRAHHDGRDGHYRRIGADTFRHGAHHVALQSALLVDKPLAVPQPLAAGSRLPAVPVDKREVEQLSPAVRTPVAVELPQQGAHILQAAQVDRPPARVAL